MRQNGCTLLGVVQSAAVNCVPQSGFISAFVLFPVISAVCHSVSEAVDFLYCTETDVASAGMFKVNDAVLAQRSASLL